jgi:UDP-GlcNAc:undecaprenyl-phosphate/decaprenyl-phosphate GlcNAc-1-phosphate transferase
LWITALINAANFMDNMDGLTAGLSAIASGFFLIIALTQGMTLVSLLAAAILGSAVGFLVYNFNPASTFMGDMGALVLGFVLAVLGIKLEFGTHPVNVMWLVPVLVLALPIFDIILVVCTRIVEGRPISQAGKDHTSHRLLSLGFNQRQTLFLLYGMCLLFGLIGLLISAAPPEIGWRIGFVALLLIAGLYAAMVFIRERFQKNPPVVIG